MISQFIKNQAKSYVVREDRDWVQFANQILIDLICE